MSKFALIGFPLGHSISPVIHRAGFKSAGVDAQYAILETPPDDLVTRIKHLKIHGYSGFNVTIPLKLPISLFVNNVDKYADFARAINTVTINPDKTMSGYNTDVIGFRQTVENLGLRGKKAGILGTGGAAHAAAAALSELNVREIVFFTRSIPNSIETMKYMRQTFPTIIFNVYQIERISDLSGYAILINATPLGMLGKAADLKPVYHNTLSTMDKDAVVYDMIYNPRKTLLLQDAAKLGLKTMNGLDMLIHQAAAAQEIWLGIKPDITAMKLAALEEL